MCCVTTNSGLLFAIVFNVCTIGVAKPDLQLAKFRPFVVASSPSSNWHENLPTARHILDANGAVERKSQCRCSRVEDYLTEEELERALGSSWRCRFMCSPENLPKSLQTQTHPRGTEAARAKLKECISEHLRHVSVDSPGREPSEERATSWPTPTLSRQLVASSAETPARSLTITLRTSRYAQNTCRTKGRERNSRLRLEDVEDFKTSDTTNTVFSARSSNKRMRGKLNIPSGN